MKGKRQTAILLAILAAIGMFPAASVSAPYTITQITDKVSANSTSSLNDLGHVFWEERVSDTSFRLWRYQSNGNVLIHSDTRPHSSIRANNQDQVVWQRSYNDTAGSHNDIYLYRDGTAYKLTNGAVDNTSREWPQINDNGVVIWVEDFHDGDEQIGLYQGSGISYLGRVTGHINSPGARLNNQGHIVWKNYISAGKNYQINFYNGSTTIILADTLMQPYGPKINDQDEVVWSQPIGPGSELILYSHGAPTTITAQGGDLFEINDLGQVAWISITNRLNLYSGGVNTEVDLADQMPFGFNNRGEIAYQEYSSNSLRCYDPIKKALVWVGSGPAYFGYLQINEGGQIFWRNAMGVDIPDIAYLANPNRGRIVPPIKLLLLD
ncbi:MAG: hypothetical protein KKD99_11100 [Proteobacteria bacterium]|nr:hypothetical protein [Pseudomonadota bacterium]MBU4356292.1 hypothetical protein [Pseudomonadota bacterium]MBU4449125.1 hypothetical protein [Pseudomonadota bacterium]MCG2772285.1 hypothetical protein [Desulfobacterales bacterium]